jgi:cobalt/nickel transport system permease protein
MFKKKYIKKYILSTLMLVSFLIIPKNVSAMHIAEGFLPVRWAIFWTAAAVPFLLIAVKKINKIVRDEKPEIKMLLALAGAFIFVLSSLKLPSLTGSCSHPTGIGLGAVLFGPWPMVLLGTIVLIFQAILLAHGGLTTLGANITAMAVVGSFAAYGIFKLSRKFGAPNWLSIFAAAAFSNLLTYVTTAGQLAAAFPGSTGFMSSLAKFMSVFAVTQIPLAVVEGLLTVLIFNVIKEYGKNELKELKIISRRQGHELS